MRNGDDSGVTYLGPRSFVIGFGAFLGGFLVLLYGVDKMTETSGPSSPLPPLPPSVSRLATLPAAPGPVVVTASPHSVVVDATPAPVATTAPRATTSAKAAAPRTSSLPKIATAPEVAISASPLAPAVRKPAALARSTAPLAATKPLARPRAAGKALAATGPALPSHTSAVPPTLGPRVKTLQVPPSLEKAARCHTRAKPASASSTARLHVAAVRKRIAVRPVQALLVPVSSAVLGTNVTLDPRAAASRGLVIVPAAAGAPPQAPSSLRFRYLR